MNHKEPGVGGVIVAVTAALAMSFGAWLLLPSRSDTAQMGLCLPSPNLWNLFPLWSWVINTAAVIALATAGVMLGRHYNFIKGNGYVLPVIFLMVTASNPYLTASLGTSTLLCAVSMLCMWCLDSCFKRDNVTQQVFVTATLVSLGSMVQYAFLILIPVCLAIIWVMKVWRWRELTAFFLGLMAPYWIGIGFGLLPLDSFRLPQIHNIVFGSLAPGDVVPVAIGGGLAIFLGLTIGLNNTVKLYAGNSRILALNSAVCLTGMGMTVAIFVDYSNLEAYLTTLYMCVAMQISCLFGMWHPRRPRLLLTLFCLTYITLYIMTIVN